MVRDVQGSSRRLPSGAARGLRTTRMPLLKRALAGIDDSPDKTTSEGMLTLIQTVISRCTELNGACYIERKQPGD